MASLESGWTEGVDGGRAGVMELEGLVAVEDLGISDDSDTFTRFELFVWTVLLEIWGMDATFDTLFELFGFVVGELGVGEEVL